jgi:translation elongation factor EF-4
VQRQVGIGIEDVLEAVVTRLPPPKGDEDAPLKALLVDAWYDPYLGVVVLVRVFDGRLKAGQRVRMINAGATYQIDRIGYFTPARTEVESLGPGEIGFITAQIKEVAHAAWATPSPTNGARRPPRCRGSRRSSPWSSAASSPWTRPISRTCARPSAGSS